MTPEHKDSDLRSPSKDSAEPAKCPFLGCERPIRTFQLAATGMTGVLTHIHKIPIKEWNRVALAPAALKRLVEANDAYNAQTVTAGFDDKIYQELEAAWKEARSLAPPTGGRSPVRGE